MFKLNKILIKRGLRSLTHSKVFSILMMILIFITGAVYTMLSSSADAFRSSYNNVIVNGELHDYVIKSSFQFSDSDLKNSKLKIGLVDKNGKEYPISKDTIEQNMESYFSSTSSTIPKYVIGLKIIEATGIYKTIEEEDKILEPLQIQLANGHVSDKNIEEINEKINSEISLIQAKTRRGLAYEFVNYVQKDYGNELYVKSTKSIYVEKENQAFKVVEYNGPSYDNQGNLTRNVNNMVIYDGTSSFTKDITNDEFKDELKYLIQSNGKDPDKYAINGAKDFKWVASVKGEIADPITLTDPNAYQAIVSPSYANKNGKHAIALQTLQNEFTKDPKFADKLLADHNLQDKYKESLIFVGSTPYFIVGIGTTPDFMYPILSGSKPVVDSNNQSVVFVSQRGYERVYDAFRSNPTEDYISIKFKSGVSETRKQEILDQINQNIRSNAKVGNQNYVYPKTNLPDYINLITTKDDPTDQLLLTQERVTVLRQIQTAVSTLTYATTTLLIVFLLFITIMVFKTLIASNRKIFATLHALGYSKTQIALSNAFVAFALTIIPTMLAYGVGYGFQFFFMNKFSNTWTLPAYANSFSLITLLVMVVLPTIILFGIIGIVTLVEMRYTIPEMLSGSADRSFSGISKLTSKINFMGIKGKYVFALSLKNIGKLGLIVVASSIALGSIMVGLGTIGRSNYAYNATINMSKYEFAIDLVTPTKEGGQYEALMPYENTNNPKTSKTIPTPAQKSNANGVTWHIPSVTSQDVTYSSATSAKEDKNIKQSSIFLKNKLQNKAILQSGNTLAIDPWSIAERLMPDNQRSEANSDYEKIIQKLPYKTFDSNRTSDVNALYNEFENSLKEHGDTPYIISYNQVLVNKNDELYTHIDGTIKNKNQKIVIKGVQENTTMINLSQKKLASLNKFKETDEFGNQIIPVLINQYLKAHWKVKEGSILSFDITNTFDRDYKNAQIPKTRMIKIVGIVDGYNDVGIYTTKEIANNVLGLNSSKGFNGVFSKSKNPKTLSTLPLYSKSGLYVATDTFSGNWNSYLQKYLTTNEWKNKNTGIETVEDFYDTYTDTPYVSSLASARWSTIDKITFQNIANLSSTIINLIETISIILSILFTFIVGALLFKSNKKKIAALWALGYRKKEICKMFLSMYLVPIIIAGIISVPISFAILTALKLFIINFGHILIPLTLFWWIPIIALGIVGLIYAISTITMIYAQSAKVAIEAFKGD